MKPSNFKPTKHKLVSGPEKMAALGYPDAKIYLKDDDVPTLFPKVEAMLTPSIRRIRTQGAMQAATRAATTTSLGSKANGPHKRTVTDTVSAIFYLLT